MRRLGYNKDTQKAWSVIIDYLNQFYKKLPEYLYGGKLMME
jgi:hypothetical protein